MPIQLENEVASTIDATDLVIVRRGASTYAIEGVLIGDILDRANHTGTQLSATISDFNSAVDARIALSPGGATDLSWTAATRTIASSTGADAVITLADGTNAGLMASADFTKLAAISGTNTGDQTSIVGITGTKAQFDAAVSDGNAVWVGDAIDASAGLAVQDNNFQIKDNADPTKIAIFETGSISAGQTRTLTVPDGSGTLALLGQTQTFSGQKTFSTPPILATSTTLIASARLPHGVAPTTPTNGDIWTTTAGIFVQINGATVGPLVGTHTHATEWGPIMAAQQNLTRF